VIEVVSKGIQTGMLEAPSGTIPASNKPLEIAASQVIQVEGGKGKSFTHYFDTAHADWRSKGLVRTITGVCFTRTFRPANCKSLHWTEAVRHQLLDRDGLRTHFAAIVRGRRYAVRTSALKPAPTATAKRGRAEECEDSRSSFRIFRHHRTCIGAADFPSLKMLAVLALTTVGLRTAAA
jgi:hypothetical protein